MKRGSCLGNPLAPLVSFGLLFNFVSFAVACGAQSPRSDEPSILGAASSDAVGDNRLALTSANQPIGQYRGHVALNQTLNETVVEASGTGMSLDFVLFASQEGLSGQAAESLRPLLGGWKASDPFDDGGAEGVFLNGKPTAVSVFLYERMMGHLAMAFAKSCSSDTFTLGQDPSASVRVYRFRSDFLLAARNFCSEGQASREAALSLWQLLVGYEFDPSFEQMMDLMDTVPGLGAWPAQDRLELLMRTILLHPVFLLAY